MKAVGWRLEAGGTGRQDRLQAVVRRLQVSRGCAACDAPRVRLHPRFSILHPRSSIFDPPSSPLQPTAYSLQPRGGGSRRAGVTLLEVLISMFVLLIGLLGVASLLPVGKFEVQRGAKYDRADACGRAAFREIKARGMLDPNRWAQADTNGTAVRDSTSQTLLFDWDATAPATYTVNVRSFVIDPLGVAAGLGIAFPWYGTATTPPPSVTPPVAAPTAPKDYLLPRITLGPGAGLNAAREPMADAIFRCQDDLVFNTPADEVQLPAQILQGGARRLSQGDYSWLMTVVPDLKAVHSGNFLEMPHRVSVAVFYKRNLLVPSSGAAEGERIATIDSTAPSGTGELTLTTKYVSALTTDSSKHLEIARPGQWLMIAGYVNADVNGDGSPEPILNYHWYRIVSAGEIVQSGSDYTRAVTLAGADWTVPLSQATVFLFDGVIAVYEKMMKLEWDSMY